MMTLPAALWPVKRVVRQVFPARVPQPDWRQILGDDYPRWQATVTALPADAPRVLLGSTVGNPYITTLDSLLAVALTLRGARPHMLLCDESLPACQESVAQRMPNEREFVKHGPRRALCAACHRSANRLYSELGAAVEHLGAHVTDRERAEAAEIARTVSLDDLQSFRLNGLAVGEHALAGAIRFFARAGIEREAAGQQVLRRYVEAAVLSARAMIRLFDTHPFRAVSAHHGIYVPQGIIGEVARSRRIPVVNWAIAYRKNSVIFSHGDTYHHTLMTEPVANWEDMEWGPDQESELLDYLKSRWNGARDWISFNRAPMEDLSQIRDEIGIDFSKTTIGLLTNVMWDAQLHYPQNVFRDMLEWITTTIRHFQQRPDLQLLIRVHPAEVTGQIKSQQPVVAEIARAFPDLPKNVFIIPPQSKVSTYAAMMQCDSVLIYGTKTGVELTSFGVPVIVAGEAWIRNKGITIDARSREHYLELLQGLPLRRRNTPEQIARARKYAYHFFFRRMVPLGVVTETPPGSACSYQVNIKGLDDLRPGRDAGLDTLCEGILSGREFIYPAEAHAPAPTAAKAM